MVQSRANTTQKAFRTLKLLEQHHEKLAQLLKFQSAHPASLPVEATHESKPLQEQNPTPTAGKSPSSSSYRPQALNPPSIHTPQREIGSSIASNLASARGIPSNRQRRPSPAASLSAQPAEGKHLSSPRKSKLGETDSRASQISPSKPSDNINKPSSTPPISLAANSEPKSKGSTLPAAPRNDEPFQRFYATFENLFSKLSAPLAFAGLPLNVDEPQPPPASKPSTTLSLAKPEERATADPDFTKIYSKAALRAVREENGGPGSGSPFGEAESFYVVPTTGGTISYADILARAQQEAVRYTGKNVNDSSSTVNEEHLDDEFVDARETPQPASPMLTRRPKPGTKTMEELTLENEALRALADHLSRRLLEFEMGAQTSSLALQRSIRAMQSPAASQAGGTRERAREKEGDARVAQLEEQVRQMEREVERIGRENEKLKGVVGRYRERWEKLKEGARVRREGTGDGSAG